jgi:hypothetical protein
MFIRDKTYDGTILQGLVPLVSKLPVKSNKNKKVYKREVDAEELDNHYPSKFAESTRYKIGEQALTNAKIFHLRGKR